MTPAELRPRSVTEIIDAAFELYRSHFATLIAVTALSYGLIFIIMMAAGVMSVAAPSPEISGAFLFVFILAIPLVALMEGSLAVAASAAYLGERPTIADVLRATMARPGSLLGSVLLKYVAIAFAIGVIVALGAVGGPVGVALAALLGMALGLWVYLGLFAVPATTVVEGRGAVASLTRSNDLAKGQRLHIFLALLLAWIIVFVLFLGVAFLIVPLAAGNQFFIAQLLNMAVSILIYPFISVTTIVVYYDLRIRKEGFDIEHLAAGLDATPKPA